MRTRRHWLLQWMLDNGVTNQDAARKLVGRPKDLEKLRLQASDVVAKGEVESLIPGENVVAASGLGIAGTYDCVSPECKIFHIEQHVKRHLYYFDSVIIDDNIAPYLVNEWRKDGCNDYWENQLFGFMAALLYIKKIGAEDLLQFRKRPYECFDCWSKVGDQSPLSVRRGLETLVEEVATGGTLDSLEEAQNGTRVRFSHPLFGHVNKVGHFARKRPDGTLTPEEIRISAARALVQWFASHFFSDLAEQATLKAALGSNIPIYGSILSTAVRPSRPGDLSLLVDLPVLENLSVPNLVRLRADEQDSFRQLQHHLRVGMAQLLHNNESSDHEQLRTQILGDIIEPDLRKIRMRMNAANRAFSRKSTVGLALGTLTATCGLLAGLPPHMAFIGGLTAASAAFAAAIAKFIDTRSEVQHENMFFLWKSLGHGTRKRGRLV